MTCKILGRLRPRYLIRDRATLTGHQQRHPQRFGMLVRDPHSGAPFELTVFKYPGRPNATQVLAIHGFRGDHHGLELIVDGLPDHEVWVPDLPGFGQSPAMPHATHNVENYANVITQLSQKLSSPALLGHSFGSVIASAATAKQPGNFRHLALLNPIAKPPLQASGFDRIATAVTHGFYSVSAALPTTLGRAVLSNPLIVWATGAFMTKTDDRRILAYTHDQHQTYFSAFDTPTNLLEAYQASITHTVNDFVSGLQLPVTLIGGVQDELSSPQDVEALAAGIRESSHDVEVSMLKRTGHLLHYERAVTTAALLQLRLSH